MRELRRLIVPAFITATAFAPACGDDEPPSTETGTGTEAGTTMDVPTSTGDATGGAPECAMAMDKVACEGVDGCQWEGLGGVCYVDCMQIDDEATCAAAADCEWYSGYCYPPL